MDQRVYYGNINPHALADYLVGTFQQPPTYYQVQHFTRAQKIVQGERVYVQIMRNGDWSSGRRAIGVHITGIAGGVSVEMGASDWLDVDETGLALGLLGALFFPPLIIFPLLQGLAGSGFSHDVWNVIDTYCIQANAGQRYRPHAPQGFYCTYCGAFNHPGAPHCHACHAPFNVAPAPQPAAQATPETSASTPQPAAESPAPRASAPRASSETRPMFALMICPNCKATVVPAHFCGNCAAPLPDVNEEAAAAGEE